MLIEPEECEAPEALPVTILTGPEAPDVVEPVKSATDPEVPLPVLCPLPTRSWPLDETDEPVPKDTLPLFPLVATPDAKVRWPDAPVAVVPVDNTTVPEAPAVGVSAVLTVTSPEDDEVLAPLVMRNEPPDAPVELAPPALITMLDPTALVEYPARTLTDPAAPLNAGPVARIACPELLLLAAPVLNSRLPEVPAEVESPVVNEMVRDPVAPSPPSIDTDPLLPVDDPEARTIVPDTPVLAPFVPELSTNEPLEPAVEASADTMVREPLDAVPVPVTIRTLPPLAFDIVVPPEDRLR
jgi:hypothetical protein